MRRSRAAAAALLAAAVAAAVLQQRPAAAQPWEEAPDTPDTAAPGGLAGGASAAEHHRPAPPLVHTDADMGIRVYSLPIEAPELEQAYELRVYLRAVCAPPGPGVHVRGFAGAFPLAGEAPANISLFNPHYQPPKLHRRKLHVVSSPPGGANSSVELAWLGPSHQGLWRFDGQLVPTGHDALVLEGSQHSHQLPLQCSGPLAALGPLQHSAFPRRGLWNVVTTTSANRLPPATLAYLLLQHVRYHEGLGFDGALLRCNKGEGQALADMPDVQAAVAAGRLVIWPWVHEHSRGHTPFYWQKPRNQLTLLAAYGADVRLAFFDLDEYLVLPTRSSNASSNASSSAASGGGLAGASCHGRPLLERRAAAWSFVRYSTRACEGSEVDIDCWLAGRPLPSTSGVALQMEKCPCRFHKPVVQPSRVVTMSVHFVWPSRGAKAVEVPHTCGFLVHLHALVHVRHHFMPQDIAAEHLVRAEWTLPGAGAGGSAQVRLPGGGGGSGVPSWLLDARSCEVLRRAAGERVSDQFSYC